MGMRSAVVLSQAIFLIVLMGNAQENAAPLGGEPSQGPPILSFDDLVKLSSTAKPEGALGTRLDTLLNTPFVSNGGTARNAQPLRPTVQNLGPVLRVALWNIERGLNFDLIRSALSDRSEFEILAESGNRASDARKAAIELQLSILQNVDVLVLNEVDMGMKRTEYRDVAHDLAAALHMDYSYGVEFVEVDPIFELGIEQVHLPDLQQDQQLQDDLRVDRERYRGLHGTAILSRYPIRNARILRLPQCYDWYGAEAREAAKLEKGKRWAAHKLFNERIARELRHGGRMALIARLAVPDLPTGEVTIVAAHLENKCAPACRRRQMQMLLADIQQDKNPVVLAGDLNTTSKTNTPTSVRDEIMGRVTDYQFWIGQTISYFHPLGMWKHALFPVRYFHAYNDPTAFHLPILWDNRERALFKTMERFRFSDGYTFDFRGESERTLNGMNRTLSDSNQRARKGFVPTYAFARDYGGAVGRFKLDWIFVKPFIQDPRRRGQSNLFAPYFPVTMREMNGALEERISDHPPLTVDLPLHSSSP
jgi:endonuclease/exonuclease/phosphatase family metal-dependent hydrolase